MKTTSKILLTTIGLILITTLIVTRLQNNSVTKKKWTVSTILYW